MLPREKDPTSTLPSYMQVSSEKTLKSILMFLFKTLSNLALSKNINSPLPFLITLRMEDLAL